MRVVLQRVHEASVKIGGEVVGTIGAGFLLLVGFTHTDTVEHVAWMADKIISLRIFAGHGEKMNFGIQEVGGAILVVSQFTLYGDPHRGRRPSFVDAARPDIAMPLYQTFITMLRASGVPVATGEFGAPMQVALVNDGPVTLLLER